MGVGSGRTLRLDPALREIRFPLIPDMASASCTLITEFTQAVSKPPAPALLVTHSPTLEAGAGQARLCTQAQTTRCFPPNRNKF